MRCQAENCHQTITAARAVIDATLTTMAQVFLCDTHGRTRELWTAWRRRHPYVEPSWDAVDNSSQGTRTMSLPVEEDDRP